MSSPSQTLGAMHFISVVQSSAFNESKPKKSKPKAKALFPSQITKLGKLSLWKWEKTEVWGEIHSSKKGLKSGVSIPLKILEKVVLALHEKIPCDLKVFMKENSPSNQIQTCISHPEEYVKQNIDPVMLIFRGLFSKNNTSLD